MKGIVYKIFNVENDILYIGSTTKNLNARWVQHLSHYKYGRNNISLYDYFDKFGVETFSIEMIKEYDIFDQKELFVYESLHILKNKVINKMVAFNPLKVYKVFKRTLKIKSELEKEYSKTAIIVYIESLRKELKNDYEIITLAKIYEGFKNYCKIRQIDLISNREVSSILKSYNYIYKKTKKGYAFTITKYNNKNINPEKLETPPIILYAESLKKELKSDYEYILLSKIYEGFKNYCLENNILNSDTDHKISSILKSYNYKSKRTNTGFAFLFVKYNYIKNDLKEISKSNIEMFIDFIKIDSVEYFNRKKYLELKKEQGMELSSEELKDLMFLDDKYIKPDIKGRFLHKTLFNSYKDFCKELNINCGKVGYFKEELKKLIFDTKTVNGYLYFVYK